MTYDQDIEGDHRPAVGDSVELRDVTGDWVPGTTCVVLRPLTTHVVVAVLDEEGRHVETMPVGYESIGLVVAERPARAPRRRLLVA